MADIRGRFGYMKRALPNFIEVGRRMSEALSAGRAEEAEHIAEEFAPYRGLFGEDLTAVRDELAVTTANAAEEADRLNRELTVLELVMLGLASLIGISASTIVSNRMMAGLERLIQGTRQVQDGGSYENLPITSNDEIGKLTVAFNRMIEDLRAKDRIKETFGKFVDPRIVANLIDPAGDNDFAERQVATVFFSDIKGFSGLGERFGSCETTYPIFLLRRELPEFQCAYGPRHRRSGTRHNRRAHRAVLHGNRRHRQPCFALRRCE
jgi:adenylate cyclase